MVIAVLGTRGFPGVQGGVESHCENLYTRLADKGHDIVVFTRRPYVDYETERIYKGVRLIPLACPRNKFLEAILHTFYGIFAAKRLKSDILHIHSIGPSFLAPLARIMGMKVVVTNHGADYKREKWGRAAKIFLRIAETLGCVYSNRLIAISEEISWMIRSKYRKKVDFIPNGVNPARILQEEDILKEFRLIRDKYILAIGRLVPEKGFHDLIDAFNLVKTRQGGADGWKLVIVGEADHKDEYSKKLKEKAENKTDIVLTGFLTGQSLQEIFSHAGMFVLPSYHEGLPIVLLEAMSYGLRCIASDIAANRSLGLEQIIYFKTKDVADLAEKLNKGIQERPSEAARNLQKESVIRKFNWERIADKTMDVYLSLL